MSAHRLSHIRIGVPRPDELADFYRELGLVVSDQGEVSTPDGGVQIIIDERPYRQLLGITVGVEDERDLATARARFAERGVAHHATGPLTVTDPASRVAVTMAVADPLDQSRPAAVVDNRPGQTVRSNRRAPAVFDGPRPPRRLGHLVLASPDQVATCEFLTDIVGFKTSDDFPGVITFLRCSTDHHNVGVVGASVPFLQHYSWECDDIDHVGHNASALLRADPQRQVWGLGRHFAGSNFYWYLRDPSGSFIEMYSDMDVIDDDDSWDRDGRGDPGFDKVTNAWGPDIPMEFIVPTDIADIEAGWAGSAQ